MVIFATLNKGFKLKLVTLRSKQNNVQWKHSLVLLRIFSLVVKFQFLCKNRNLLKTGIIIISLDLNTGQSVRRDLNGKIVPGKVHGTHFTIKLRCKY